MSDPSVSRSDVSTIVFVDQPTAESAPAATVPWPEPDRTVMEAPLVPAPKFPLEILGGFWARWVCDQAEVKNTAPDYVAAGLLAGAGAVIGNACWASPWAGWEEPPALWVVAIGDPSSGKSQALDPIRTVLHELEQKANADFPEAWEKWQQERDVALLERKHWEQEVRDAIKNGSTPPPLRRHVDDSDLPVEKRLLVSDQTPPALARIIARNENGVLLMHDELSVLLQGLGRSGSAGPARPFYLEGYGGRPYRMDRVGRSRSLEDIEPPLVIPALTFGILGTIQPDILGSYVFSGDDDGLSSRFFPVWPESRPPKRPRINPPDNLAMAKLIKLYDLRNDKPPERDRCVIRFNEPAADAFHEFRCAMYEREAEATGLFRSWLGKASGKVIRLACILHHLRWVGDQEQKEPRMEIGLDSVAAAITLVRDYALPMARRCFNRPAGSSVERHTEALAKWILRQVPIPTHINLREIMSRHAPIKADAAGYDRAAAELEEAGWIRRISRTGPGRKPKTYEVNPALRALPRSETWL